MAKNDPRSIVTTRTKALEWWNSLTLEVIDLQEKYFWNRIGPSNLTGREIEIIYRKEVLDR